MDFLVEVLVGCFVGFIIDCSVGFGGSGERLGLLGETAFCEIATIMNKADIIGVEIFPGPIKAGEFAEIGVFQRDVFAGIVASETGETGFSGGADLEWEIEIVFWDWIGFVAGDDNGCGFFRVILKIVTKYQIKT